MGQPTPAGEEAGGPHWPACLLSASPLWCIPSSLLSPNSRPQEKWTRGFNLEGIFSRIHIVLTLHGHMPFFGGKLRWGESGILELELASLTGWMRKMRNVSAGLLPAFRPPDSPPTTGQTGPGLLLLPSLSSHSPLPWKEEALIASWLVKGVSVTITVHEFSLPLRYVFKLCRKEANSTGGPSD